jgi:hypothetical protein
MVKLVYTCSMAQVYLPMGYPIQTGHEFEFIVYQKNLVRLYVLPSDPRNNSQLFERRFLSDISKVRGTLGIWGKGALRAALGHSWGTVLYQLIKADVNGWWSAAKSVWNGFDEFEREAWREGCLYQATYNDVGEIFFCLSRVVMQALDHYTGLSWLGSTSWGGEDVADCLTWWERDRTGVLVKGDYTSTPGGLLFYGSWGGTSEVSFYFFGRQVNHVRSPTGTGGTIAVYLDGVFFGNLAVSASNEITIVFHVDFNPPSYRGLHHLRLVPSLSGENLTAIQVR